MSRRLTVVCTMVLFAFVTLDSGCSSVSNPLVTSRSDTAGIREIPRSIGFWTAKAPMPTARGNLAVGVVNGILYAVGGTIGNGLPLNTVEAYDPATNTWTARAPMHVARSDFGVGVVNGILYAVGGDSWNGTVEAYDPRTDTWTYKASMPKGLSDFGIGVINNILYFVGGLGYRPTGPFVKYEVEAYDPATDTWSKKAGLPIARYGLGAGVVNGKLYAVGGWHYGYPFFRDWVDAYDPATNTWAAKAPMPTRRTYLAVGVVNGMIYAVGGWGNAFGQTTLNTVEVYDPATNIWATEAPMPTRRYLLAGAVTGRKFYAVGGWNANKVVNAVEVFDPR